MKGLLRTFAVTAAAGLSACGGAEHPPQQDAQPPIAVVVAPVAAIDTAERLEAGGVVAARESSSISSRMVATVSRVPVRAGDRVRAGQVLVTLDARDAAEHTSQARAGALGADKALAQARAEQTAAEAEHRLATAWQKRIAVLHARNSATDQERDEAEARLAAAAARLTGTQAGLEGAEARIGSARAAVGIATATESFATLRAPFDGLVTERLVDPGSLAAPGVPLIRIESLGARQVVARVDEARAAYVRPGDRLRVLLEHDGKESGDDAEGIVAEVARAVGADQRAFTVKVALPGGVTARSGSFARLVFRGRPRRTLVLPPSAVRHHGQVASVYVAQNGVARLRIIQTGVTSAEGVEVLAGLDAGESIVTSPSPRLADGSRITIAGPAVRPGGAS